MSYPQLVFVECPSNVTAGKPVHLGWTGTKAPVNLTLWASTSGYLVSDISDNTIGNSYTWTPNISLSDGGYFIELWILGGAHVSSEEVTLDHDEPDEKSSTTSKLSTASTTSLFSTTGPSSSSSPFTETSTLSSNPSALASDISRPLDAQQDPVSKHPMSDGAIAGTAVGAVIFILLVLAASDLYWRRRRRRRTPQKAVSELPNSQPDTEIKSDPSNTIWIPELDREGAVDGPHELPGTPTPLEEPLGATERVVEIGNSE